MHGQWQVLVVDCLVRTRSRQRRACCYRDAVTRLADTCLPAGETSKRRAPGGVTNVLPRIPSCRVQKKDRQIGELINQVSTHRCVQEVPLAIFTVDVVASYTTTASLACGVPRPADSAAPATQESELWEPGKRLQLSLRLGSEGGASRLSQSTGREHSAPRMVRAVRCKGEHRLVSSFSHSIPSRFGCAVELGVGGGEKQVAAAPFQCKNTRSSTYVLYPGRLHVVWEDAYYCDDYFRRLLQITAVSPS